MSYSKNSEDECNRLAESSFEQERRYNLKHNDLDSKVSKFTIDNSLHARSVMHTKSAMLLKDDYNTV